MPKANKIRIIEALEIGKLKETAELAGKISIALFLLSYAIGLIVVNIYLNNFGIYSLSLFRLNYVAAGIWTLFFVIVPTLLFSSFISIIYGNKKGLKPLGNMLLVVRRPRPGKSDELADVSLDHDIEPRGLNWIVVAIWFLFLGLSVWQLTPFFQPDVWLNVFWSILTGLLVTAYFMMAGIVGKEPSHQFSQLGRTTLSIMTALICGAVHVHTFSTHLYGMIPSYLGGGAPQKAQFVLAKDSGVKEELEKLNVKFITDMRASDVQILMATEDSYIILLDVPDDENVKRQRAMVIDRKLVSVVFYDVSLPGTVDNPDTLLEK